MNLNEIQKELEADGFGVHQEGPYLDVFGRDNPKSHYAVVELCGDGLGVSYDPEHGLFWGSTTPDKTFKTTKEVASFLHRLFQ